MDVDIADDIVLLTNTLTKAESLLHSLELAAGGIGLYVNTDISAYMYFNQKENISTINGGSMKLVDDFIYLRSNVSSTENDINICLMWHALLSIGYQSYGNQTYPMK